MPDLHFEIIGAAPLRDMATPALAFDLRVSNNGRAPVRAVLLRCQIQIETARRRYSAGEQDQLRDLFDEPQRWGQTLRPLLWINASVNVPAFTEGIVYPISVPCTYDLNVPVTKYFHALAGDTVPLTFYSAELSFMKRTACKPLLFPGTKRHTTGCRFRSGKI